MFENSVSIDFTAIHAICGQSGPIEESHEHKWRCEATFVTSKLDQSGMAIDFRIVKNALMEISKFIDGKNLNNISQFSGKSVSAETVALYFYEELSKIFGKQLKNVTVWEDNDRRVTYYE